ncbi:MAG: hypothetical protein ACJAXX_000315 [Roseivirga sp.]|jgi:hypothetical protein
MKKSITQLLSLFFAIALLVVVTSCEDDETTPVPTVTSPSTSSVEFGSSTILSFSITAQGGYASAVATAVNGTASITAEPAIGATSGTIEVNFTAGTTAGAAGVTLAITDANAQVSNATAVINVESEITVITVTENIAANTTWATGKTYILANRIIVLSGSTLTIEPGVVVKGQVGSGTNATALLIARGAQIIADGTSDSPIIFTSIADELEPGMIASPNLSVTDNGLWGGLIVLGRATISADAASIQIEGVPPSDTNGLYGGSDDADNSGIIRYVSIRHGGANIGEGNEINGLTLGGVGSGTTIEFVEIIGNQDDGIEWFGGSVNVTNAVIYNVGDDAVDTDMSWHGTLDNFIVITPGDECFELDGPEGSPLSNNTHIIKNGSIRATVGSKAAQGLADLDANTYADMSNLYFFDLTDGQDFDLLPSGFATLTTTEATLPAGATFADYFKDGSDAAVTGVAAGANTVGADKTKFATWSWTAVSGALDSF